MFFDLPFQQNVYGNTWSGITKFVDDGIPVLSSNYSKHVEMVEKGHYTNLADITSFELEVEKNCDLAIMKEKLAPMVYGVGTQNNSVYTEMFSEELVCYTLVLKRFISVIKVHICYRLTKMEIILLNLSSDIKIKFKMYHTV